METIKQAQNSKTAKIKKNQIRAITKISKKFKIDSKIKTTNQNYLRISAALENRRWPVGLPLNLPLPIVANFFGKRENKSKKRKTKPENLILETQKTNRFENE